MVDQSYWQHIEEKAFAFALTWPSTSYPSFTFTSQKKKKNVKTCCSIAYGAQSWAWNLSPTLPHRLFSTSPSSPPPPRPLRIARQKKAVFSSLLRGILIALDLFHLSKLKKPSCYSWRADNALPTATTRCQGCRQVPHLEITLLVFPIPDMLGT